MSTIARTRGVDKEKNIKDGSILKVVDFVGEEKEGKGNKREDSSVEIRGGTENKGEGFIRTEVHKEATKGITQNCINLMLIEFSDKDLEGDNESSIFGRRKKN